MLELRIRLQKLITWANAFPRTETYNDFNKNEQLSKSFKETSKMVVELLDDLVELKEVIVQFIHFQSFSFPFHLF